MLAYLKQTSFFILTALFFLNSAATDTLAQANTAGNDDSLLDLLFTIKGIKVDETARTASLARSAAIKKAEDEAFETLLVKLTQPSDRDKIPELPHSEKQALMRGIEIVSEQSSPRRYIATYNIAFEASYVSDFFAQYEVPHVLSPGKGLLVLHGHERGLASYLWEYDEKIENAQKSVDWINRIRSYQFPFGSVSDRLDVTIDTVREFDIERGLMLAKKYDQASVLMIYSRFEPLGNKHPELVYKYYLTDGAQEVQGIIFNDNHPEKPNNQADDPEVSLLARMYKEILETIDSGWREQLLVDTSTGGTIKALVPTLGIEQFSDVEKRLSELSIIKNRFIRSVELPLSKIEFEYAGREEQLVLALSYQGLILETYGDTWLLRRTEDQLEYEVNDTSHENSDDTVSNPDNSDFIINENDP